MAKGKKKWQPWQLALAGCGVSVGLYGAMVLGVSYLVVAGLVPATVITMALTLGACISVLVGGFAFGQRLPMGVMGGCLAIWAGFWAVLLLVAWGCYGGVCWSVSAVPLLLASLAGAVASGGIARNRRGRRLSKRFG